MALQRGEGGRERGGIEAAFRPQRPDLQPAPVAGQRLQNPPLFRRVFAGPRLVAPVIRAGAERELGGG